MRLRSSAPLGSALASDMRVWYPLCKSEQDQAFEASFMDPFKMPAASAILSLLVSPINQEQTHTVVFQGLSGMIERSARPKQFSRILPEQSSTI